MSTYSRTCRLVPNVIDNNWPIREGTRRGERSRSGVGSRVIRSSREIPESRTPGSETRPANVIDMYLKHTFPLIRYRKGPLRVREKRAIRAMRCDATRRGAARCVRCGACDTCGRCGTFGANVTPGTKRNTGGADKKPITSTVWWTDARRWTVGPLFLERRRLRGRSSCRSWKRGIKIAASPEERPTEKHYLRKKKIIEVTSPIFLRYSFFLCETPPATLQQHWNVPATFAGIFCAAFYQIFFLTCRRTSSRCCCIFIREFLCFYC